MKTGLTNEECTKTFLSIILMLGFYSIIPCLIVIEPADFWWVMIVIWVIYIFFPKISTNSFQTRCLWLQHFKTLTGPLKTLLKSLFTLNAFIWKRLVVDIEELKKSSLMRLQSSMLWDSGKINRLQAQQLTI